MLAQLQRPCSRACKAWWLVRDAQRSHCHSPRAATMAALRFSSPPLQVSCPANQVGVQPQTAQMPALGDLCFGHESRDDIGTMRAQGRQEGSVLPGGWHVEAPNRISCLRSPASHRLHSSKCVMMAAPLLHGEPTSSSCNQAVPAVQQPVPRRGKVTTSMQHKEHQHQHQEHQKGSTA